MTTSMQQWPALVITEGPHAGQSFTISGGEVVLGREADATIVLDSSSVSRHHARLRRHEDNVVAEDLHSTNGTFVNEDRLIGPVRLGVGDTLRLGDVELQFGVIGMPARTHGEGPAASYDFGGVHGPVNAGSGSMNVGSGQQNVAGRDLHYGHKYDVEVTNDYDPSDEMFNGRGPGRVLAAFGSVVALVGFGIWMSLIFSAFGTSDPSGPTPFDHRTARHPHAGHRVRALRRRRDPRRHRHRHVKGVPQTSRSGLEEESVLSEFTFGNVSGPVNAGSGNMNVGSGSQTVAGGDMHIGDRIGADPAMAMEIASMRQQLADLRLSSSERATAEKQLDALENAADKEAAAGHLESLVAGVKKADALASAGSSFIESAAKIAKWLGPVAVGVLSFL